MYLIDAILKTIAGPYVELFSQRIINIFREVYDETGEKDKLRLDYLLSTWEGRNLLPNSDLEAMRKHVGIRKVTLLNYPQYKNILPIRKFGEVSEIVVIISLISFIIVSVIDT